MKPSRLVTSTNLCCCAFSWRWNSPGGAVAIPHFPRFPHATHEKQTKMFHTIHPAVCPRTETFPLKPAVSSSHYQNLTKIKVFVLLLGDNHCYSSIVMFWFMWMTLWVLGHAHRVYTSSPVRCGADFLVLHIWQNASHRSSLCHFSTSRIWSSR